MAIPSEPQVAMDYNPEQKIDDCIGPMLILVEKHEKAEKYLEATQLLQDLMLKIKGTVFENRSEELQVKHLTISIAFLVKKFRILEEKLTRELKGPRIEKAKEYCKELTQILNELFKLGYNTENDKRSVDKFKGDIDKKAEEIGNSIIQAKKGVEIPSEKSPELDLESTLKGKPEASPPPTPPKSFQFPLKQEKAEEPPQSPEETPAMDDIMGKDDDDIPLPNLPGSKATYDLLTVESMRKTKMPVNSPPQTADQTKLILANKLTALLASEEYTDPTEIHKEKSNIYLPLGLLTQQITPIMAKQHYEPLPIVDISPQFRKITDKYDKIYFHVMNYPDLPAQVFIHLIFIKICPYAGNFRFTDKKIAYISEKNEVLSPSDVEQLQTDYIRDVFQDYQDLYNRTFGLNQAKKCDLSPIKAILLPVFPEIELIPSESAKEPYLRIENQRVQLSCSGIIVSKAPVVAENQNPGQSFAGYAKYRFYYLGVDQFDDFMAYQLEKNAVLTNQPTSEKVSPPHKIMAQNDETYYRTRIRILGVSILISALALMSILFTTSMGLNITLGILVGLCYLGYGMYTKRFGIPTPSETDKLPTKNSTEGKVQPLETHFSKPHFFQQYQYEAGKLTQTQPEPSKAIGNSKAKIVEKKEKLMAPTVNLTRFSKDAYVNDFMAE